MDFAGGIGGDKARCSCLRDAQPTRRDFQLLVCRRLARPYLVAAVLPHHRPPRQRRTRQVQIRSHPQPSILPLTI